MAFTYNGLTGADLRGGTLLLGMFGCYDTIGDPDFDMSRDETLHMRSVYEFLRDELDEAQRAELDRVDAFWRARPKEFNADFEAFHYRADKKTELKGFVQDENGNTPEIPAEHWWWWPLEVPGDA